MGWQGINLTSYRQQKWVKRSIKNLIVTSICFIITNISTITLYLLSKDIEKEQQTIANKNQKIKQDINTIKNKILKIQSNTKNTTSNNILKKESVLFLLHYIHSMEIQGNINSIHLYIENTTKIKIIGILNHQNEFEKIEKNLEKLSYHYQIDHLQSNEIGHIEFGFTINLGENNEK